MIGVIPKAHQLAAVEEFFQLFKTPWEFYRPGSAYDVVVATADDVPDVDASLLVLYGAAAKTSDARDGMTGRSRHRGGSLSYRGTQVPVYGEMLTFDARQPASPCVATSTGAVGFRVPTAGAIVIRLGYDLFDEVGFLLSAGQPIDNAHIPTLDVHIRMLREWMLDSGVTFWEIPPAPAGHDFVVSLTHDIDFAGIRDHRFDHTMWGFLHRSTVGAIRNLFRGRLTLRQLIQSWRAALSLPFVHAGWVEDFWEPFGWYLRVEENLPATYFLIPFKGRAGDNVASRHASRRAAAYDVADLAHWTKTLLMAGCEIGVHGIDAWHSVPKGRDELKRIGAITGEPRIGVRMHWLLRDENTSRVLEDAGYDYDSSAGYNETVGYRNGTTQVFRPLGAQTLLEFPLHIQDGALFFHNRLDLSESDAWKRCAVLIEHARKTGGVVTVLWHDRSHAPERFWGDFYVRLVRTLSSLGGWFGTGTQVVGWFRKRREIGFERIPTSNGSMRTRPRYHGGVVVPPFTVRVHRPNSQFVDLPWNGETVTDSHFSLPFPAVEAAIG
jgi:hypothetical protein